MNQLLVVTSVLALTAVSAIGQQDTETETEKQERLTTKYKNALKECYRDFKLADREDTALAVKNAKDKALKRLYANNGEEFGFECEVLEIDERGRLLISTKQFFKRFPLTKKQARGIWLNAKLTDDEIAEIEVGKRARIKGELAVDVGAWNPWDGIQKDHATVGETMFLSHGKTSIEDRTKATYYFKLNSFTFELDN